MGLVVLVVVLGVELVEAFVVLMAQVDWEEVLVQ